MKTSRKLSESKEPLTIKQWADASTAAKKFNFDVTVTDVHTSEEYTCPFYDALYCMMAVDGYRFTPDQVKKVANSLKSGNMLFTSDENSERSHTFVIKGGKSDH